MKQELYAPMRIAAVIALSSSLLGLGACSTIDPYERADVWRPTHVNEANTELQVARPTDLQLGRGTLTADGDTAARAIDRLRTDKVKPLPDSSISKIGNGS